MNDIPSDLIPTRTATQILRCHPTALHKLCKAGRLRAWHRGGRCYFSESEVRSVLQAIKPAMLPESLGEMEAMVRAALRELKAAGVKGSWLPTRHRGE